MNLLIRNVEVGDRVVDVRITDAVITAISAHLAPRSGEEVVDGRGGALLPGLHDHHVHLMAMAAARESVDCSRGLSALTQAAHGTGWIRGVNAYDSADRHQLDRLVADRPVRVQHRSGGLWMLNTAALRLVASSLDDSDDVERDHHGNPTGRLWRFDARLRRALPHADHDLHAVINDLHRVGIASVTDATPDLDPRAVDILTQLPMPVTLLGDPTGSAPAKILLRDHDLPDYDELCLQISNEHSRGRAVAVHCVTRESLVLTLAALEEAGRHPDDRIEHAAVVPEPRMLAGLTVVTQPAFVSTRGADYRRDVDRDDLPYLYPYASLLACGASVRASSDAPFGPYDPWTVIAAARDRDLIPAERVSAVTALSGYLTDTNGRPRRVRIGAPAEFTLLHVPLPHALNNPDAGCVRAVITPQRAPSGAD